jgi:hypothetical protein
MSPRDEPTPAARDATLRASLLAVAGSAAALALGSLAVCGPAFARSVVVGGTLATANLWVLSRVVDAFLTGSGPRAARQAWRAVGPFKTVGVLVVATLLLAGGVAAPLPFLVGLCSLPIGIAIGALVINRGA